MHHLILTLVAIALMGVIGITSIQYINPTKIESVKVADRLEKNFLDLENGYDRYVIEHGVQPNNLSEITPAYAFIPPKVYEATWSYGQGGADGRWFCLSGPFPPVLMQAAMKLHNVFSPQAYFISSSCGATSESVPPGEYPVAAITYWVSSYQ